MMKMKHKIKCKTKRKLDERTKIKLKPFIKPPPLNFTSF